MKESVIEWPKPPYFSFAANGESPANEICLIYLFDGKKLLGQLIEFMPDANTLIYRTAKDKPQETLAVDKIKSIQLLQPMELVPNQSFLEDRAEELFPPSEKQTYAIEYTDGEMVVGYTYSYVTTNHGLYIYPTTADSKIIRGYFPRASIKSYKIGQKIGEILIQEKLATKDAVEEALKRQDELRNQRIGDYLFENQIVTSEELQKAIRHQESRPILKLGEALRQLELITEDQLQHALNKQKENRGIPLGRILVDMGIVDEQTLKGTLAKKLGIPYVSLSKFNFDPNAIRLIGAPVARKHLLIPLCMYEGALVVAFEDPMNVKAIDEVRFLTQMKTLPAMASREDIVTAIDSFYGRSGAFEFSKSKDDMLDFDLKSSNVAGMQIDDLATKLFSEENSMQFESAEEPVAESDNTLVQLVNKMILDAYQDGVSDIHIETYPDRRNTQVRFRKDGTLVQYLEIPSNFRNALISRIKIMSQLDISERRKPQDGKLDFKQFGPANVELRVATIPTANGLEDVVMRVLAAAKPVPVDKLGLAQDKLENLKKLMQRPYGLILVCGPTGSGKTTSLHSLMGYINTPERKIWTAEDPVEITQQGLRQVQVNAKIGWTFAAAMRSFLRADPDVIMVGEMRDQETTKIGIEASLTGHLVLSTLHTNSAPESIVRMLDLGMDPFNFADALLAIMAQRLAKTLCDKCKEAYEPSHAELEELAAEFVLGTSHGATKELARFQEEFAREGKFTLYRAKGCKECNNTGYRGRLGLYELMIVTPEIKRMIQKRAPVSELLEEALNSGMLTLKQDGINKVLQGKTDIAQVRAVCV
ncbi:GspE/PulE family protein [Methylovorus sp. MP688]|uniref:GspE/PulE family protein n=1 Tax=Methylovorus sp. (strain MP688) TaxID=887061 RepID=UPI0002F48066|nr:ATPase, T2SS/T4P/T4SS family [Methylovorus sp. MP688]